MSRVTELVDRRHRREPITAVEQKAHVAGECRRVARYRDDDRYIARRERAGLRLGALARRVEQHGVEAVEILVHEGILEQIAPHYFDRLEAGRGRRRNLERGKRR